MSQYFLLLSASTWAFRALAWAAAGSAGRPALLRGLLGRRRTPRVPGPRGRTSAAPWHPPPAACRRAAAPRGRAGQRVRRRAVLLPLWTCSWKSTCRSIPAASTTRRSWTSPHWPRALLDRRADSSACVDRSSCSSDEPGLLQLLGELAVLLQPVALQQRDLLLDRGELLRHRSQRAQHAAVLRSVTRPAPGSAPPAGAARRRLRRTGR